MTTEPTELARLLRQMEPGELATFYGAFSESAVGRYSDGHYHDELVGALDEITSVGAMDREYIVELMMRFARSRFSTAREYAAGHLEDLMAVDFDRGLGLVPGLLCDVDSDVRQALVELLGDIIDGRSLMKVSTSEKYAIARAIVAAAPEPQPVTCESSETG